MVGSEDDRGTTIVGASLGTNHRCGSRPPSSSTEWRGVVGRKERILEIGPRRAFSPALPPMNETFRVLEGRRGFNSRADNILSVRHTGILIGASPVFSPRCWATNVSALTY